MDPQTHSAVGWLLGSDEPAVRVLARRDVLGEPPAADADADQVLAGARVAESLISWQWPDGGWNCDRAATGRPSFHESLAPAWGLHEYWQATGRPVMVRRASVRSRRNWSRSGQRDL